MIYYYYYLIEKLGHLFRSVDKRAIVILAGHMGVPQLEAGLCLQSVGEEDVGRGLCVFLSHTNK